MVTENVKQYIGHRNDTAIDISKLWHYFPESHCPEFEKIIHTHRNVFATSKPSETTRTTQRKINVTINIPVRSAPYPVSESRKKVIEAQLFEMLKHGIISPFHPEYVSPVVLAQTKIEKYVSA